MTGNVAQSAGNGGDRPATHTAALPVSTPIGARRAAGAGQNSRPALRAGFARGAETEGGPRAARYVHTPLGTSPVICFRGNTAEGEEMERRRKKAQLLVAVADSLDKCGRGDQAKALLGCGRWFRKGVCPSGGYRLEVCPCDSMFCPDCADRRSKPLQRRILARCNRAGKSYWFLTLTVPNVKSLTREFLTDLVGKFAALRETEAWKNICEQEGKCVGVSGGVYSLECVFNEASGTWHPHLHVLIEVTKKLPFAWLAVLKVAWHRVTGNAEYLHLTRVYGKSKRGKKLHRKVNRRGLRELVKYVTKCAEFAYSPRLVDEFLNAFKNVRRIQSFGSFLGEAEISEREPGEDSDLKACSCGGVHPHRDFKWQHTLVHVSQTWLLPDGTRQLCFDYGEFERGSTPDTSPPFELEREAVERDLQLRIGFSGPLPEESEPLPSLFTAAA